MKSILPALLAAFALFFPAATSQAEESGAVYQIKVADMSCAGCALTITDELKKLDQVTEVFVDPRTKTALFATGSAEGPGKKAVFKAVKAAGYEPSAFSKVESGFAEAKSALVSGKG